MRERETLPTLSACWEGYHFTLIRAQYGPRLPHFRSKRSPFRAPFKNKPKSAVFWQSDKIKRPHIAVLRADHRYIWVFDCCWKQWLSEREYDLLNRHYMGLNLGLSLQIVAYLSTEFRAWRSGDNLGPDLPMGVYSGRIFYDGENPGGVRLHFCKS